MDGLLHLNPKKKRLQGSTLVAGTVDLSEITSERKIKIVTYVSSKDAYLLLKMETRLRFITADDANKQMILTSQISSIDANATQTKQEISLKIGMQKWLLVKIKLRSSAGLEGKFVMVTTGEKDLF